jgi:hypothetical protein
MKATHCVPSFVILASIFASLNNAESHEVYVHGRCHQSSCAHYLIRDVRIEAVLRNGTLKKFSYTGDSVGCAADVEDYTKDDCFTKRPDFKNFEEDGYVYCSTSAPAYIFWNDAKLVITHLNPASGPLGYQVSAFAIYATLCHGSELNEENELRRAQYIKQLGYSELPHRDQESVLSIDKAVERLVGLGRAAPAPQLQRFESDFPLAEGLYAKDRRFCQMPREAALAASESAFIEISARRISFYETECTVNRFARRGNQLHLSAVCEAEGSKQNQNHMLTLLSPNSFSIQRQVYLLCRR